MNITTYCSAVSLGPPAPRYAIGLFVDTLTWDNFVIGNRGVLQVLTSKQADVVPLLGKQSGRNVDKIRALRELGHAVIEWEGHAILRDCAAAMLVESAGNLLSCGDHDLAVCDVRAVYGESVGGDFLYTGPLRDAGVI